MTVATNTVRTAGLTAVVSAVGAVYAFCKGEKNGSNDLIITVKQMV